MILRDQYDRWVHCDLIMFNVILRVQWHLRVQNDLKVQGDENGSS